MKSLLAAVLMSAGILYLLRPARPKRPDSFVRYSKELGAPSGYLLH